MASTYTPIATTTLGSAAASYTFSSIPSTYTDLILIFNGSASSGTPYTTLRFNGDTASNYSDTTLSGNGSTAGSGKDVSTSYIYVSGYDTLSTGMSQLIVNFQNYSNTTTYKTALARSANAANGTSAVVGLWRSTAAINSITVLLNSASNYATGSTFTLYGILAA